MAVPMPRLLPRLAPPPCARSTFATFFRSTPLPRPLPPFSPFLPLHRPFHASTANMGITAYFDIEYTDAALDKARRDAERSGGAVPPRKHTMHPAFGGRCAC